MKKIVVYPLKSFCLSEGADSKVARWPPILAFGKK